MRAAIYTRVSTEDQMSAIEENQRRQSELENRIELAKQVDANIEDIKQACEMVRSNLKCLRRGYEWAGHKGR